MTSYMMFTLEWESLVSEVTVKEIYYFYGSDNVNVHFLLQELADVINGVYDINDARKDIKGHYYE